MTATLQEMTEEIRANNVARGWRSAEGGPGENTFGDYMALLHTEVAEATEAYRDYGLDDATTLICNQDGCSRFGAMASVTDCTLGADQGNHPTVNGKPEGVGSELADVLIRTLDMADVFGYTPFDMDCEVGDISPTIPAVIRQRQDAGEKATFGDWMWCLHNAVTDMGHAPVIYFPHLLRVLVAAAERCQIDLTFEYRRKMDYNLTRPFQHGGRTMAKTEGSA